MRHWLIRGNLSKARTKVQPTTPRLINRRRQPSASVAGTIPELVDLGFREGTDKPIYNPQEELMDLDLQEEIGKLVGPRLMSQRAHDIERIMSSVARLTSSSIEGLENLTSELHDLNF